MMMIEWTFISSNPNKTLKKRTSLKYNTSLDVSTGQWAQIQIDLLSTPTSHLATK